MLLAKYIEITFSVCINRVIFLHLKESSDMSLIFAKGFLLLNLHANKTKESTKSPLASQDSWQIANSVLNIGKSSIPPLFNDPEVFSYASDKSKLIAKNFLRTLILMTQISFYLFSLPELI